MTTFLNVKVDIKLKLEIKNRKTISNRNEQTKKYVDVRLDRYLQRV